MENLNKELANGGQAKNQKEYQAKKISKGVKRPKCGSDNQSPPHQSSKKEKFKGPQPKIPDTTKPDDPMNQGMYVEEQGRDSRLENQI